MNSIEKMRDLKDNHPNALIRARTQEEANFIDDLIKKVYETADLSHNWNSYKEETIFSPRTGHYGSTDWYINHDERKDVVEFYGYSYFLENKLNYEFD